MTDTLSLRMSADTLRQLRRELLHPDGQERLAFVYLTREQDTLFPAALHPVPDEELAVQGATAVRPSMATEREHVNTVQAQNQHLLVVHSHPFSNTAAFSGRDRSLMDQYRDWLAPFCDGTVLAFGVLGKQAFHAAYTELQDPTPTAEPDIDTVLAQSEEAYTPLPTTVVGDWMLDPAVVTPQRDGRPAIAADRFDRHLRCFTAHGQQQLAETHVAVVGCGGIGSFLAEELARIGVGALTLIDPDHVEESNLPRLIGARDSDVGHQKVRVVQEQCVAANPDCTVTAVGSTVQEAVHELQQADLILAGVDQMTARIWLNEFAAKHVLPYIDVGTRIDVDDPTDLETADITGMRAVIQVIAPGTTACFTCLDRDDAETARQEQLSEEEIQDEIDRGYIAETDLAPEPAVVYLNGVAASLGVGLATKVITGFEAPPGLVEYDALTETVESWRTHPAAQCAVCRLDGLRGSGLQTADDDALAAFEADDPFEFRWVPEAVTQFFRNPS